MSYIDEFGDIEKKGKISAAKIIGDLFKRPEDLDKVSQELKRFKSLEEATEVQLKLTTQIQLDNVKEGLEKLDESYKECLRIDERMKEISDALVNIDSLSDGLDDLQRQSKQQKQLSAAMDNMEYLVKVPALIRQATVLIKSENYLQAHRIIEELESTRDEIMRELYEQQSNEADLFVLESFFRGLDQLNEALLSHVRWCGGCVINACITQNKVLVSCLRIIEREQLHDQARQKYENLDWQLGKPKLWKQHFFTMIRQYIHNKIFESALDEEKQKGYLTRHLEAIRVHTIADLKIIKNIGVIYFPPHYRVYEEFVQMYHEIISEYIQKTASEVFEEVECFQLLGWINTYHTDEFMGSPELCIDFNSFQIRNSNLLSYEELDQVAQKYIDRQRLKLQSWFNNSIRRDEEDWLRDTIPDIDGESHYHTSLSSLVLKPLAEVIGPDKVLSFLGEKMHEKYYPMFLSEFKGFQKYYKTSIQQYRDKYLSNITEYYRSEYLVANCNNCLRIDLNLVEMINFDLKTYPTILVKIDQTIKEISKEMLDIAQVCLNLIMDLLFHDLADVFQQVLSEPWNRQQYIAVDYILGTVDDYNNIYMFLKPNAYKRLIRSIIRRIVVEYLKACMTRRPHLSAEDRKRVGVALYYEGDKLYEYFRNKLLMDDKVLKCCESIKLVSHLMQNNDVAMMRLDVGTLVKNFPGIGKDQMVAILLLRGDIKSNEANEIASDFQFSSPNDSSNIFKEVADAMK